MITNYFRALLICFGVMASLSCGKKADPAPEVTAPPVTPPQVSPTPLRILNDFKMIWNDEFDGTTLDLTKWMYRADGVVRNLATASRQTISLDGKGNLVMKVTKDANGKYYVGQVATDGLFQAKYGYFECRAKMNESLGPHVAFWLQSNTMGIETNDPATNGVEIDIFEYHRKKPDLVFHNLHWNGYGTNHMSTGTNVKLTSIGMGYHTFGLEWNQNQYIFYVDGKETWRTSTAVSQIPQYMILSTELTGWGGDPETGNFPDQVVFDYVRVYLPK
ncbi:MAG TPA: glycoside hydrolase family 16 protein [Sphingobacteriaceae bacterium]